MLFLIEIVGAIAGAALIALASVTPGEQTGVMAIGCLLVAGSLTALLATARR